MKIDELREMLESKGFERLAGGILKTAEPCLRLVPADPIGDPLEIGTSKFGGVPDLPNGFSWPDKAGRPLFFLAQINLRDIPESSRVRHDLPNHGLLAFWYDCSACPWGFDPADKGAWVVHYIDANLSDLSRTDFPEYEAGDLDEEPQYPWEPFNESAVHVDEDMGFNFDVDAIMDALASEIGEEEAEELYQQYSDFVDDELMNEEGNHQMFGNPHEIQGDMADECQLVSNGIYLGGPPPESEKAKIESLRSGVKDWKLLLQLDTDSNGPDWMWGDCGKLYFWIRQQELSARDFSNCWCVLQCY